MSEPPNSLTTCFSPPKELKAPDFFNKVADLAKSTGMDQKCEKTAQSAGANASASGNVDTLFGAGGFQASVAAYERSMAESGCGQFALNASNTLNSMANISCSIQKTENTVNASQVSGNSIIMETIPLTQNEESMKASISSQLITAQNNAMILISNPKLTPEQQQKMVDLNDKQIGTYKALLANYSRDINITNSTISQSIVQSMKSSISLSTDQITTIVSEQKAIAQNTAESKLAQDLGVDALSPNSKNIISSNIANSSLFSNQNVQDTVNSIKLEQSSNNQIKLYAPGNINITGSTISQSIVADMVTKAVIGNAATAGLKISTDITSSALAVIASDGKSAGSDALIAEMNKGNANAIKAGKVTYGGGAIFAVIIVVMFVLGFGAIKSGGGMIINNGIFIMAFVSIIASIVFFTKAGVGNKILGVILMIFGLGGIVFGLMLKARMNAIGAGMNAIGGGMQQQ
jgi:hypothetical protein